MAKVFDLVHKVSGSPESESRIPFEDEKRETDQAPPKKRVKVEIIFFYLLLFAVFFIMGAVFLTPNLFNGAFGSTQATPSADPNVSPAAGFAIDKEGQSVEEAAKELGVKPSPSPIATASPAPAATEAATPVTSSGAKIQILNGTNRTGAADALRTKLANKGIVVESIGNYKKRSVAKTTVYFAPDYKKAAQDVLSVSGGIMIEANSTTRGGHDILVVIGLGS